MKCCAELESLVINIYYHSVKRTFHLFIDVLRTQPNDLLSWSAAYFRCIADNVEPPTKIRFEEINSPDVELVTVEYLKVLIKQVCIARICSKEIIFGFITIEFRLAKDILLKGTSCKTNGRA